MTINNKLTTYMTGDIPHHVYPTFKPNNRLMITYNANFNIDTDQLPGKAMTL